MKNEREGQQRLIYKRHNHKKSLFSKQRLSRNNKDDYIATWSSLNRRISTPGKAILNEFDVEISLS